MSNYPQGWQPQQNQQYPPQRPPMPPYQQPPFPGQRAPDVVYDGKTGEQITLNILLALMVIITLGFGVAYVVCVLRQYDAEHTIICGRRLRFDGKAKDLFLLMIAWGFFTILTLGIYAFWARVEYKKWIAEHTHFQ